MKTWKDFGLAAIGVTLIALAHVYVFAIARPSAAPPNDIFVPDQALYDSWIKYMDEHPELYAHR